MSTGVAIAKRPLTEDQWLESPPHTSWTVSTPSSSVVFSFLPPKAEIVIKREGQEVELADWPGFHTQSRLFETAFLKMLARFLEGAAVTSRSPATGLEIDIEEPRVLQMPMPETKWLSATVVNLGPATPRLVLDFIEDEG